MHTYIQYLNMNLHSLLELMLYGKVSLHTYHFLSFRRSCPHGFNGVRCEASLEAVGGSDEDVIGEEERQRHPCDSSPCLSGGTCVAAVPAFAAGRTFVCRCPPGKAGDLCEEQGEGKE